jgi:pyruvate dehydrogenase E2 component (dihydrolipoamide acetyltransferase)
MPVEVILPKVDMDMASAKIAKWHVKNGDTVKKGGLLFEIETDKAAMEIDCPADGVIHNISAPEGATVPVGSRVAEIFLAGETPGPSSASAIQSLAPPAQQLVPQLSPEPMPNAASPAASAPGHFIATPLARKLAKQLGIDLKSVAGSGPRGRIVAADVEAAKTVTLAVAAPVVAATTGSTLIPLDGMRRTIAQRLTLSKQTIPHFYLNATCDMTILLALRERLNQHAPRDAEKTPRWKLSINDFVIKAMGHALQQVPAANVNFTDDGIRQFTSSDVGVAVAIEGGLFTPVLRAVESLTLSQISLTMKDLAARAKQRKLAPAEYHGGATAISNLGMFGIESFTAIINPPQASILAVGAGVERFVPVNGQPVLRTQMAVTLSCDHRAIDGAVGAQLLSAFRTLIEEPALLLV